MFDRARASRRVKRAFSLAYEPLEGRQLLNASIEPIPDVTVPQTLGLQVPVEAAPGTGNQTFTVTTDNNNVVASVAQGQFFTINVQHASSGPNDPAFAGPITFQLFNDLTPLTAGRIEQLVAQGFYNNKTFHRVATGFPGTNDFIVQGGSVNGDGTGNVNQPGFPFEDEFVQQLAFTGSFQLAMANAGPDTNQSQFFITTGQPRSLDFKHAIFGQLVAGQNIVTDMTKVPRDSNDKPLSPIIMASTSLSNVNPNGVIHINANNSQNAVFTTVTVNATETSTGTTASRSFKVEVVPNLDSNGHPINERPILGLVPQTATVGPDQPFTLQLQASDAEASDHLTFVVEGGVSNGTFTPVQNATATVTPTGLVTVTPNAGFVGDIKLIVGVQDGFNHVTPAEPVTAPDNTQQHLITLTVTNQAEGARVIDRTLIVTPPPRTDKGTNTVVIDQNAGGSLQVIINGQLNIIQPSNTNIDDIVVYGSKASDKVTVTPNVRAGIRVILDGGHGIRTQNVLQAGDSATIENGWFSQNVLIGGPADDILVGRAGHVHFVKSAGNDEMFAGVVPQLTKRSSHHVKVRVRRLSPPSGTFFAFIGNRLVPLSQAANLASKRPASSGSNGGTNSGSGSNTTTSANLSANDPAGAAAAAQAARAAAQRAASSGSSY